MPTPKSPPRLEFPKPEMSPNPNPISTPSGSTSEPQATPQPTSNTLKDQLFKYLPINRLKHPVPTLLSPSNPAVASTPNTFNQSTLILSPISPPGDTNTTATSRPRTHSRSASKTQLHQVLPPEDDDDHDVFPSHSCTSGDATSTRPQPQLEAQLGPRYLDFHGKTPKTFVARGVAMLRKYSRFIGPGLMVSVAYMDPGNYSTAVAAGSAYKYKLLFLILLSNCLAIFLQVLSAKLGAVTGLDLAANCRANLSPRLNFFIYVLAEIAIIATDLAEVVGTAIALNILFHIPLLAGVVLTVVDVLIVLMAYRPNGSLTFIRIFEGFVLGLVALTVVCFGIELYLVSHDQSVHFSTWEVLKGFLPSPEVVDLTERKGGNGLYLSLAILGATVMPHLLYLGSGVVQARLKDFDIKNGFFTPPKIPSDENGQPGQPDSSKLDEDDVSYRPSIHAINDTMTYTIVELVISLFTVALFVNLAILIVAGATLRKDDKRTTRSTFFGVDAFSDSNSFTRDDDSGLDSDEDWQNADLFTIYHLLTLHISPFAGYVFALALLFSGQSAGVVCTLAGQMVSEGFLRWSFPPAIRRIITRGLAITPCFIVVLISGREGLASVLNGSQVVLSLLLPVVSAPLIWFTSSKSIMRVPLFVRDGDEDVDFIYDTDDDSIHYVDSQTTVDHGRGPVKFRSSEPAIRLQDLRNSHPCLGVEDEDDDNEHQQLISSGRPLALGGSDSGAVVPSAQEIHVPQQIELDEATLRVRGYKDMSNGPVSMFVAVLVWAFIAGLNIFLIISTVFS